MLAPYVCHYLRDTRSRNVLDLDFDPDFDLEFEFGNGIESFVNKPILLCKNVINRLRIAPEIKRVLVYSRTFVQNFINRKHEITFK